MAQPASSDRLFQRSPVFKINCFQHNISYRVVYHNEEYRFQSEDEINPNALVEASAQVQFHIWTCTCRFPASAYFAKLTSVFNHGEKLQWHSGPLKLSAQLFWGNVKQATMKIKQRAHFLLVSAVQQYLERLRD